MNSSLLASNVTNINVSKSPSLINATSINAATVPLTVAAAAAVYCKILVVNDLDQAEGVINVPEKFSHMLYLKNFRTEACQKFQEHRCIYHKPYTCFNWHFPNQRRRRPFRLKNGHFSYSPDVYCDYYDENSGHCPNGDECPYLHKNAGDTERRYHMRYFRTLMCNNDRDTSGRCLRNGTHCAFSHGPEDLRPAVFDVRELNETTDYNMNLPASLEKERILSEDPNWNDLRFVLAHYKTEPCKRNPRMCRQGYACPFYHNGKDKRRDPIVNKYRSTPCPTVKCGEEWGDPELCDLADQCGHCHTRTEQQFHPEIYKSTKCKDMIQQRFCPRGPFCAFAHVESEMNYGRDCRLGDSLQLLLQPTTLGKANDSVTSDGKRMCGTPNSINSLTQAILIAKPSRYTDEPCNNMSVGSSTSVESGLGSLLADETPPRFRRTNLFVKERALDSKSNPLVVGEEDDLDLEDIIQRFGSTSQDGFDEECENNSASDCEVPMFGHFHDPLLRTSTTIGIHGNSQGSQLNSPLSSLGSSFPFCTSYTIAAGTISSADEVEPKRPNNSHDSAAAISSWTAFSQKDRMTATLEYRAACEAAALKSAQRLADAQSRLLQQLVSSASVIPLKHVAGNGVDLTLITYMQLLNLLNVNKDVTTTAPMIEQIQVMTPKWINGVHKFGRDNDEIFFKGNCN